MKTLSPTDYNRIENSLSGFEDYVDKPSKAPVIWLLVNHFYLSIEEAQDLICDGEYDKGVDAIFVDDENEKIVLIQSERAMSPKGLGDSKLSEFAGKILQFIDSDGLKVVQETKNADLKRVIDTIGYSDLLEKGYRVGGLFISNRLRDDNTISYLESTKNSNNIELFDAIEILSLLDRIEKPKFVHGPCKLPITKGSYFETSIEQGINILVGMFKVKDIIKLPGIDDYSLFSHNIRLELKDSPINKSISETLSKSQEHNSFPAFHNGITMVCRSLSKNRGSITVDEFSVVNGCQSIRTLFKGRDNISDNLKLIVKLINIDSSIEESVFFDLIDRVTYRSNNQNSVNARDLYANSDRQRAIAKEIAFLTNGKVCYMTRKGEQKRKDSTALTNDRAGQMILSLYTEKPWLAHQKDALFRTRHDEVFKFGIHGEHVLMALALFNIIDHAIKNPDNPVKIENLSASKYLLTKYVLLYALGQIILNDGSVRDLLVNPKSYLVDGNLNKEYETTIKTMVNTAILRLNDYLNRAKAENENFDYKAAFKKESEVKRYSEEAKRGYKEFLISLPILQSL